MFKTLLRNNSQSPISLPPPYTGIIAPGDSVVLDDPPSVVSENIGIVPWLINFLTISQVSASQPNDGHDKAAAAAGIATALGNLEAPLDLNGQRIINVADPIDQQDVATKQYVDTHGGGGGGGGTVTSVTSGNAYLTVTTGTTTPVITAQVGTGADKLAAATDTRFNTTPSTAGSVVYDTGTAYSKTPTGATGQVLKVGDGGLPEWGSDSTTPSGPATGSLAGYYPNPTIAAGVVTNTEISATAAIETTKLSGLLTDITGNGLAAFVDAATKVARTYYVSTSGVDAVGTLGSVSDPFATIQAALTAADAEFTGGEYVLVSVGPGQFTGDVSITRKNVLLVGAGTRPELFATKIVGNITVNPAVATNIQNDAVAIAGIWVAPPTGSTAPAVKLTGTQLFSLLVSNCYLYTTNAASTAAALACDNTHASRPRIVVTDSILATEAAGPSIVQLDRGDARFDGTRINHNSGVTSGAAGDGIQVLNNSTLWMNGSILETRTHGAGITATGASAGTKLLLTNSAVTAAYSGAEDTTHGVVVGNVGGGAAAAIYQTNFSVADTSATVYAIKASGVAVVAYGALTFSTGTNSAFDPTLVLYTFTEKLGTVNLPSLAASLPLKLDANKTVTAAAIALNGLEVTGTLPTGKGGTGIATAPVAGGVVYGGATTQLYSAAGTAGMALISGGAGAPAFGALALGTAANVSGILPALNQAAQTMAGDVTGTTGVSVVAAIRGNSVKAGILTSADAGKAIVWSGAEYEAATITPSGGGGGGLTYYLNYGVAGESPTPNGADKQLALTFSTGAANTGEVTAPNGGGHATLAQFVTPIGQPGATTIPPGLWDVNAYLLASHIDSVFYRAAVYTWNGTTLSPVIATSDEVEITNDGPTPKEFTASVYVPQTILGEFDRVVIRLEISKIGAAPRTATGYFGDSTPSHAHTAIGSPGGTGVVKVVDGIVQAPATLIFNADIDLDAQIAVNKLDGYAAGGTGMLLHASAISGEAPTWSAVSLSTDVNGQLAVGNGGTGLASGISGGIPYFSALDAITSSAALSANAIVLGGGAGAAPSTLASPGTTFTVLHGNESGAPSFGQVALATDVSGTLPLLHGGTNASTVGGAGSVAYSTSNAYGFSSAGTAGQVLLSGGIGAPTWTTTLAYTAGGTGNSDAPTLNGVAYGDGSKIIYLAAGSEGQVLKVSAGGTPEWATDAYSGILPIANGGTGTDTTATKKVFAGPVSGADAAPSFRLLETTDLPAAVVLTSGTYNDPSWIATLAGTKITGDISGTAGNVSGTVAVANGGTGAVNAATARTNLSAAASGVNSDITSLTGLTTALAVTQGGTGTLTAPTAAGGVIYADTTSAYGSTAAGTTGQYLKSNGALAPSWESVPYDIASAIADSVLPTTEVFRFVAVRPCTVAVAAASKIMHRASAKTAPVGGAASFDIKINNTLEGTLTFADLDPIGEFTVPQLSLVAGDVLTMVSGSAMYGIADVGFTFFVTIP